MLNFKSGLCATILVIMTSSSVEAVEMVPYQAGYNLSLNDARESSSVSAVTGQIAYGVEEICGGWLFQQSGTMNMHLTNGKVVPQLLNFSSVEKDGSYQFSVNTGGTSQDIILGRAEMPKNGKLGQVVFSRPNNVAFTLPADTLFPAAHTAFMIEGAQAGKTQLQSHIFEGTDTEPAKLLVVFVSPLSDAGKAVINELGGDLKNHMGWNFQLAYFDPTNQTGEPLYEVGVDQLDNGIALRWVLDYGSHSVEMKMVKIETLGKPKCSLK